MPPWLSQRSPADYLSDNYVVVDFETDTAHGEFGNPVWPDNRLLLACWKVGPHGCIRSAWGGEFEQRELLAAIEAASFVVAHNGKYEAGWLHRCGFDLRRLRLFDTKIAAYLERDSSAVSTSLDAVAKRHGLVGKDPCVDLLIRGGVNPVNIPRDWLEQRCRSDVEATELVFKAQRERLASTNQLAVLFTRCNLTPPLAEIEQAGMCLDADAVGNECRTARAELAECDSKFRAIAGDINPRSRDQLAALVYDSLKFAELKDRSGLPKRTESGKRKTDAKTLAKLKAKTAEQKEFLELQKRRAKVDALLSKNLNVFEWVCEKQGGILHGQFNQTVTATGRLSSTGLPCEAGAVQFQNMPRRLKPCFKARRDGWLIAEADGSQLEFRVAAYLGQDEQAMADIANISWDAHITSAAAMAGVAYDVLAGQYAAGDKRAAEARQNAKPETFKPLYGGQRGTKEQERWYAEFRRRYPGIAAAQAGWVDSVLRDKRLITPWGQRFYWPEATISDSGYVNVTSQVYNYPVQALATAEIIPVAVWCFWQRVADAGLSEQIVLVNTVHDSVVAEIDPVVREQFIGLAKQSFTHDVYWYLKQHYSLDFNVPLGVGIKIGTHWGTGEEVSFDIYPDGREIKRK